MSDFNKKRLAVAPMMEWTDRHCRSFHRTLSKEAVLYTEMVTTGALLHGDVPRHLDYSQDQHPVVLQLGPSSGVTMRLILIVVVHQSAYNVGHLVHA